MIIVPERWLSYTIIMFIVLHSHKQFVNVIKKRLISEMILKKVEIKKFRNLPLLSGFCRWAEVLAWGRTRALSNSSEFLGPWASPPGRWWTGPWRWRGVPFRLSSFLWHNFSAVPCKTLCGRCGLVVCPEAEKKKSQKSNKQFSFSFSFSFNKVVNMRIKCRNTRYENPP